MAGMLTELLELLCSSGIRFQAFGTFALSHHHPAVLRDYRLPDIDIWLQQDWASLPRLAGALQQSRFEVLLWGEPWDPRWTREQLQGKWYLRAHRDGWQIDLTYEVPFLDFAGSYREVLWQEGWPLCCERDIWYLKLIKDRGRALDFSERWDLPIPEEALALAEKYLGRVLD